MASDSANTLPVLIVGGGIGGVATALALSRRGRPVQVLEQAHEFREIGAGIQMPPNAFKAFAALGVLDAVRAVAAYPDDLKFGDMLTGEIVYRAPIDDGFISRFGYRYALLHRADILECLVAACRESDLVTLTPGERVTRFTDVGDRVVVETAAGTIYEGCGLVCSDGLWSLGRAALIDDGLPPTDGYVLCRGVVPVEDIPEELYSKTVTMWGGPGLDFFHYPLRRHEIFNIGASYFDPHIQPGPNYPTITREHFLRQFKDACPHVKALLQHIDVSRTWVLHHRLPVKDWSKGRVTLLGDAAHPTSIYISQGACMALEDAVILAEIVGETSSIEQAFEQYRNARYLRTARIQFTSREFGKLYHARGVQRELRNRLLSQAGPGALADALAWLWGSDLSATQEGVC
ncbi:FAD-dependent monooxygenase [Pseudorhodoplanes sp.]|uniref:FAD-dependent monooxygenase n=1 Tax=Pseudorhodoplanes sp. TaxID=1934341 RepID=UPI003D0A00A8